jgi:hypothetical protein
VHIIEGGIFKGIANLSFEDLTHGVCQVQEGFEEVFSIVYDTPHPSEPASRFILLPHTLLME